LRLELLSLPPDFKKRLSKIIQERKSSQRTVERARPDYTSLESTIPGQPVAAGAGEFYMVRRNLSELYSDADTLVQRYCNLFASDWKTRPDFQYGQVSNLPLHGEFMKFLSADPVKTMFLDAETTGFSNTPLFLVGIMYFDGENFIIDQLFARDYSEEVNLLHHFSEFAPGFDILITFNGKSFDAPFIRDRMIYHRKHFEWTQTHVDILHHSRRRWKDELPDCRLQTLESYICHRRRVDDVPGELVPDVYREFVRSGDIRLLADVFHHNALDLITLVELTVVLLLNGDQ
jgi:uncharacterized protein YprB with RNaseH-like and TPR domain